MNLRVTFNHQVFASTCGPGLLVVAVAAALFGYGTNQVAAATVTAANYYPSGGTSAFNTGAGMGIDGILFDNEKMQTFNATFPGRVSTIAFTAYRISSTTAPLRIDIVADQGNFPGPSLGHVFVAPELFSTSDANYWEPPNIVVSFFDENIVLGYQSYGLLFSSDIPDANYRLYGHRYGYSSGELYSYQNGQLLTADNILDLIFEITVVPVPEPESSAFALVGLLGAAFVIIRRRTAGQVA